MISVVLIAIAGFANAVMDLTRLGRFNDNSSWWDWRVSWKRKWKEGSTTQERFLGSSSVFVFVTDAWHFFQQIMLVAFCGAVVAYEPILGGVKDFFIYLIVFSAVFHSFFHWIIGRE